MTRWILGLALLAGAVGALIGDAVVGSTLRGLVFGLVIGAPLGGIIATVRESDSESG